MAKSKSKSATRGSRKARPKYLGVKVGDGQIVKKGYVLVRQRGTKYLPGKNVAQGKDDTLYALCEGKVKFKKVKKLCFDGKKRVKTKIEVIPLQ